MWSNIKFFVITRGVMLYFTILMYYWRIEYFFLGDDEDDEDDEMEFLIQGNGNIGATVTVISKFDDNYGLYGKVVGEDGDMVQVKFDKDSEGREIKQTYNYQNLELVADAE
jgi:hypothetical protein